MKSNVGNIDKVIRILFGIILLMGGVYYETFWGLVGLVPILTGLFRWCPWYIPLGIDTSENKID